MKNRNIQCGFTLVELLAVIAIFGVIGGIAASILVTSLRISKKTDVIINVKQNGTYILDQTEKTLREARFLKNPFPCGPQSSPTQTQSLTTMAFDGTQTVLSCNGDSDVPPNTIANNGVSLLDTNSVKLNTCSFTCIQQSPSDYPVVTINFSLLNNTTSKLVEASTSAILFNTSVVLRNLNL